MDRLHLKLHFVNHKLKCGLVEGQNPLINSMSKLKSRNTISTMQCKYHCKYHIGDCNVQALKMQHLTAFKHN